MEEVVVVADVDKPTTLVVKEDFERDTIEKARTIRRHQGNHEAEVSCGGEADLHKHLTRCHKNPGHSEFIPVHNFKKYHLPCHYRDNVTVDWIKTEADLTCRLSVRYTSEHRPQCFPGRQDPYPFYQDRGGDWLRTGTGCVSNVSKYTEKNEIKCQCEKCNTPGTNTPRKVWGKVVIVTACHVVLDSDEARHTTCEFFYDTSTTDVSKCSRLTGFTVECSDLEGDMCMMTCVTHDMDLVDKLVKMCHRRLELFEKVRDKYWLDYWDGLSNPGVSYVTDPTPGHVVVISHPHGCSKHISIGWWTQRETQGETQKYKENSGLKAEFVCSSYKYNAATCPGSSGAPVIRLLEKGKLGWWWLLYSHPHSGGDAGNNNYSGSMEEFVSFPPVQGDTRLQTFRWCHGLFTVCVFFLSTLLAGLCTAFGRKYYMWLIPGLLIALAWCYRLIPLCGERRRIVWFRMFGWLLLSLVYLVMFVVPLVNDGVNDLNTFTGILCVVCFLATVSILLAAIKDPQTLYRIQGRLRRRTRLTNTITPTTSASAKQAPSSSSSAAAAAAAAAAIATSLAASKTTPSLSAAKKPPSASSLLATKTPTTATIPQPSAATTTTAAATTAALASSTETTTSSSEAAATPLSSLTIWTTTSSLLKSTTTTKIDMNYGTKMNTEYSQNSCSTHGLSPVLVRY